MSSKEKLHFEKTNNIKKKPNKQTNKQTNKNNNNNNNGKLEAPRSLYSSPGYNNISQKITNVALVIADPLFKKMWAGVPPFNVSYQYCCKEKT